MRDTQSITHPVPYVIALCLCDRIESSIIVPDSFKLMLLALSRLRTVLWRCWRRVRGPFGKRGRAPNLFSLHRYRKISACPEVKRLLDMANDDVVRSRRLVPALRWRGCEPDGGVRALTRATSSGRRSRNARPGEPRHEASR